MKSIAALLLLVLLPGCIVSIDGDNNNRTIRGSGVAITDVRSFSSVDAVSFATEGSLRILYGNEESVTIETETNLLDHIRIYVRAGTLHIETEDGIDLDPRLPIRIVAVVRDLNGFSLAGSGDVEMPYADAENFSIAIAGSGNAAIDEFVGSALEVSLAGSGNLESAGTSNAVMIAIAGSGNFQGPGFSSSTAEISILGSGSAELRVSNHMDVSIAGSGSVRYSGTPQIQSSIVGSGSLIRLSN